MAFRNQLLLERNVVLDNAVMYYNNFSRAITMRVGVFFGRSAMCGPAGVTDTISAIHRLQANGFFQIAQLAFGAANLQAIPVACNGNAGGIVPAILKPF